MEHQSIHYTLIQGGSYYFQNINQVSSNILITSVHYEDIKTANA